MVLVCAASSDNLLSKMGVAFGPPVACGLTQRDIKLGFISNWLTPNEHNHDRNVMAPILNLDPLLSCLLFVTFAVRLKPKCVGIQTMVRSLFTFDNRTEYTWSDLWDYCESRRQGKKSPKL
jgi:hypothetical protein